jgi:hypothetical protein
MQFHRQIEGSCRLEHGFCFLDGKGNAFAEGVDGIGKTFGDNPWKGLIAYDTYVSLVVFLEFLGEGVGAQEGGFDIHRTKGAKLSGDPEHFDLCLDV